VDKQLEPHYPKLRLWTGIGLIFLVSIQVVTGYMLVAKLPPFADFILILKIHTQFSWILIYFFLTHVAINLRYLFKKWWSNQTWWMFPLLLTVYLFLTVSTLYVQFLK